MPKVLSDTFGNVEQQEDAHELLIELFNRMQEMDPPAPTDTNHKSIIEDIFQGIEVTTRKCTKCQSVSPQRQPFNVLSVDVWEKGQLSKCLEDYTCEETLSVYLCGR